MVPWGQLVRFTMLSLAFLWAGMSLWSIYRVCQAQGTLSDITSIQHFTLLDSSEFLLSFMYVGQRRDRHDNISPPPQGHCTLLHPTGLKIPNMSRACIRNEKQCSTICFVLLGMPHWYGLKWAMLGLLVGMKAWMDEAVEGWSCIDDDEQVVMWWLGETRLLICRSNSICCLAMRVF